MCPNDDPSRLFCDPLIGVERVSLPLRRQPVFKVAAMFPSATWLLARLLQPAFVDARPAHRHILRPISGKSPLSKTFPSEDAGVNRPCAGAQHCDTGSQHGQQDVNPSIISLREAI